MSVLKIQTVREYVPPLIDELLEIKAQMDDLIERKKTLEVMIKGAIGEGNSIIFDNGIRVSVSHAGKQHRINLKALKKSYPDIYRKFSNTHDVASRITITKPKEAAE